MSPLKYNCQCFLLLTFQMNLRVTCLTLTPVFPHDFLCQLAIVSDFKCQISVVSVHLSLTRAHVHVHSNCPGWLMQSIRAISLTVASSDRLQDLWDIGLLCQNRMNSLIFLLYFHLSSPPPHFCSPLAGGVWVCSTEWKQMSNHIWLLLSRFVSHRNGWMRSDRLEDGWRGVTSSIPSILIVSPI